MTELSNHTSVFSSSNDSRITKRNRRPLSCSTCRAKKSKCDRLHPCGTCTNKGEAATCHYVTASNKNVKSHLSPNPDAASRLRKLEDMVNGLMHQAPMNTFVMTPPSSSVSPPVESAETSAGGHLSHHGAQVNYIGGTHWASILESIHDIRSVMDSAFGDTAPESVNKADSLFGQQDKLDMDQVLAALPDRQVVDSLVASYFKEPLLSLTFIHSGKFRREYEAFWRSPLSTSYLWLSILFSIIFMGEKLAAVRGQALHSDPGTESGALGMATRCLVTGRYLKSQPYSVEALLFHFHCIYVLHGDHDTQPWPILTMATRLAQKMGYHRDPRHLSARFTPFESELRRRAWYYIEIFDITMSAQQGIPAMINEDECDVQYPIVLLDEDFDENTIELPPPRPDTAHIPMLFFTCKAVALRHLRPIIRHALSSRRFDLEENKRLHDALERSHSSIPQCLRVRKMADTSFVDQDFLIMQRLMLELQYIKGFCILHRPFMTHGKSDSTFDASREVCRDTALRGLDLQADYHKALQPQGRLYGSRWMFTNITMYEMFSAAMIVCLDLAESRPQRYVLVTPD
jgi:hypothetical protein